MAIGLPALPGPATAANRPRPQAEENSAMWRLRHHRRRHRRVARSTALSGFRSVGPSLIRVQGGEAPAVSEPESGGIELDRASDAWSRQGRDAMTRAATPM